MRRFVDERTILDAQKATGWGTAMSIGDFRHKILTVVVTGQGSGDVIGIKVATSNSDTVPTFSSAVSVTNRWDYDRYRNKNTGTLYATDGEFTFSNSNTVEKFVLEDDTSRWVNIEVSTYTDANTSGSISAFLSCINDTE